MRPSLRTVLGATVVGLMVGGAALPLKEARADAPPVKVMTLTEALAYARAHQPAIRAAMARVAAQQEEARVPRAEWLPSVGATVQGFAATANNSRVTGADMVISKPYRVTELAAKLREALAVETAPAQNPPASLILALTSVGIPFVSISIRASAWRPGM